MSTQSAAVQRAQEPSSPKIVKFETLSGRIDSVFQDIARRAYQIFEGSGSRHGHDMEDWLKAERELLCPVDVKLNETDRAIEVQAEIPGFDANQIQITAEPRRLIIAGTRETAKQDKTGKPVYAEAMLSDLLRVINLPAEVDPEKVTATMKNSVVTVTLPKVARGASVSASGETATEVANELEDELEDREQSRYDEDRAAEQDLNQGMSTGTYDSTHRGVNWPASYRVRSTPAKRNKTSDEQKSGSD